MEEPIWHLSSDFTKLQPKDILKGLYRDDEANYQGAKSELVDQIQLIDDAVVLYIESVQGAYRHVEQWKSKPYNIRNYARCDNGTERRSVVPQLPVGSPIA